MNLNMLGDILASSNKYLELGAFFPMYQFLIARRFADVNLPIRLIDEGVSPKSSRSASAMICANWASDARPFPLGKFRSFFERDIGFLPAVGIAGARTASSQ
jgi:hypothetical protein